MKIKVTEDAELRDRLRKFIMKNDGQCPCCSERKCICEEFLNQNIGACECGLYIKIEK